MIALLKFVHIAAIAIWTAGLISLPSLYVQRAHVTSDDALYRMQRMTRARVSAARCSATPSKRANCRESVSWGRAMAAWVRCWRGGPA